jgi:hypothetical protein
MHRDRDLLPWILSGLLMASIAIAIGAGSIQNSRNLRVGNLTVDPTLSSPATSLAIALPPAPLIADPAVPTEPEHQFADAPAQMTSSSSEPTGQIWECTTKGVKTFSDNPCGEKSALREVRPVNTMAPTPEDRSVRGKASDPRYMPAYVNDGAYAEQDSYPEPAADESYDSYPVFQGFAYLPRIRALHPHRPIHHNPGMPVRRN